MTVFHKRFAAALFTLAVMLPTGAAAQEKQEKEEGEAKTDEKKEQVAARTALKPYKDVITDKAITQKGMFDVHCIDDRYYFELPNAMIGREVLLVVRTVRTGGGAGNGGESIAEVMLRWDMAANRKKIYLRKPYVYTVADRESDIYKSFESSYVEPIFQAFDIRTFGSDSSAVIDATDMYGKDNFTFGLAAKEKSTFHLGAQEDDKSFIYYVKAFPCNIECRSQKTYKRTSGDRTANSGADYVTFEINHSMQLLSEKPMTPRYGDDRVGFFTQSQTDYSYDYFRIKKTSYVRRWRLEPSDTAAFRRGEAVEPVKPIVFYIDPNTPKKLVPYFKEGIEAWQTAFEQAGFKNAILARDVPSKEEDPDFDAMDARYSMVNYLASETANAYGPHVADPRSGEILEAHVCIYHNLMRLVSNWYRIQTAGSNPQARTLVLSDEVMGELYRQVVTHEVGHSLGLAHNFASSSAIAVDSLRSPSFTDRYGASTSVMDYARYNYVAQPEDGVRRYISGVGPYDRYAIEWGYRPILDAASPKDELPELDKWVRAREGDPAYLYVKHGLSQIDPRGQMEDLGDDAIKAVELGLRNLRYVMENFERWIVEPYETYAPVKEYYEEIIAQWKRYMGHVNCYIGGQYETYKHQGQDGPVYVPVERSRQKAALKFICENAFDFPDWLYREDLFRRFDPTGVYKRQVRLIPSAVLGETVSLSAIYRMMEASYRDSEAYSPAEFLSDVTSYLYRNAYRGRPMSAVERSLQRSYVDRLKKMAPRELNERQAAGGNILNATDVQALTWNELGTIYRAIKKCVGRYPKHSLDYAHLQLQLDSIHNALHGKQTGSPSE
ncbi:MAG: zinc-dependent metalloprotease [Rikenellaceae bacterium]|jgi:hypothetical protein|nr:zinc-dependent metalloprotease [Rikenellaceae bacterium]